jgi:hypothetical protein
MGLFLGLSLGCRAFRRHGDRKTPSIVPTVIGLALLFVINIIFLVDIELTLRHNRLLVSSDESVWSFGQILAMLLLVLPLRDLVETFLSRHEKQRKKEHTESLKNAIREKATAETILDLLSNGADVNAAVEGTHMSSSPPRNAEHSLVDCDYATVLQLASHRGDVKLVTAILKHPANVNILGEVFRNFARRRP